MAPLSRPSAAHRSHGQRATSRRAASRQGRRDRHQSEGLSLVELLVGVVISIVVLGAAVRALVSLIRGDTATQVELNRKDEVNRVLGVMQDEIRNAQRVESGGSLTALSGCTTTPQLILRGASSDEDIAYGLRSQAADLSWRGPGVLVRCGRTYAASGTLDTTASRAEQVILDTVAANGFSASTLGGSGTISRSVELSLVSNASGSLISNSLQVPINSNQIYGMASSGVTACPGGAGSMATGCPDPNGEAMHYKPSMGGTSITGTPSMEDIFYFDGNRNEYSLRQTPGSGSCTSEECTVRIGENGASITLRDADVLVFKDQQIRL